MNEAVIPRPVKSANQNSVAKQNKIFKVEDKKTQRVVRFKIWEKLKNNKCQWYQNDKNKQNRRWWITRFERRETYSYTWDQQIHTNSRYQIITPCKSNHLNANIFNAVAKKFHTSNWNHIICTLLFLLHYYMMLDEIPFCFFRSSKLLCLSMVRYLFHTSPQTEDTI